MQIQIYKIILLRVFSLIRKLRFNVSVNMSGSGAVGLGVGVGSYQLGASQGPFSSIVIKLFIS